MKDFKKTVRLGMDATCANIFCKVEFADGRLSISGVEGPLKSGECRGGCGQIGGDYLTGKSKITHPAPGWDEAKLKKFFEVWEEWHLNDMTPNCEHQKGWDTAKELELVEYTWSDKFHDARARAEEGTMPLEEYAGFGKVVTRVHAATIAIERPKYESPEVKELLAEGWIREDKKEKKGAGWVSPIEHPEGLLTKACPTCGYKYGTEWKTREVPAEVLEFLKGLPDTDKTPAWV